MAERPRSGRGTSSPSSTSGCRSRAWAELGELAERWARSGSLEDRERLAERALPLASKRARGLARVYHIQGGIIEPDAVAGMALAKALASWRADGGAGFGPWLHSKVRHELVDELRRWTRYRPARGDRRRPHFLSLEALREEFERRNRQDVRPEHLTPPAPGPDPDVERIAERAEALYGLGLTQAELEALNALHFCGLHEEAAEALGLTPTRVWQLAQTIRELARREGI